jgi:MFS family permease
LDRPYHDYVGDRFCCFRLHSIVSTVTGIPTTSVFYSLRLLLGACEAGFFPGIIFYLTLWFPAVYRARVISLFMLAIPISSIIGSPISGMLLGLSGRGLGGLAVAIHSRGVAVRSGWHQRPGLSNRFPAAGSLAPTR